MEKERINEELLKEENNEIRQEKIAEFAKNFCKEHKELMDKLGA